MKLQVRRFTGAGIARFEAFLDDAGAGAMAAVPGELLVKADLTEELPGGIEVDAEALGETRLQAARYLDSVLSAARLEEPERDVALWAWFSAVYFDVLCPRDRQGRYRPGAKARYVPMLDKTWRTYRHRLLGPYLIYQAHRDGPDRALCLLSQPLVQPGQLVERFASRPRLVACPAAVGVATRLYCGVDGSIRRGAAANVERLCDVLMQLDRTYDLYGMTPEALLKLLPREFDGFRGRLTAAGSSAS